jgi:putative ABC transport system permease protein
VAVIGQTVVDELFPPDVSPLERIIKVNDIPFRVIGVLAEKGGNQFANDDNQVIIPITTARAQLRDVRARNGLPGVTAILMQGNDPNSSEVLKTDATSVLREQHNISYRGEDDFRVFNQADLLQSFGAISTAITVFLSAIAGISLLVGGIGVMNIMLVTVTERTREIGLRKAIGAKRRDILIQFLVEAMTLSLVGGAIGMAIGVGGAAAVSSLSKQFQPSVSPITVALATGVSALVGLFAGLYPALRAARMNPIEALRHE